jgi:hypothetical protein
MLTQARFFETHSQKILKALQCNAFGEAEISDVV